MSLNANDLDRLGAQLRVRHAQLGLINRQLYGQTSQNGDQVGHLSIHFGENAAAAHDADFSISCIENLEDEIAQIDDALQRLDAGTYGRCEECGEAIPLARLERLPFAPLCVPCKTREEEGT